MAYILHIETSNNVASICVSKNSEIIAYDENSLMNSHGAWLHVAIQALLPANELNAIDAISISQGPGSYTGLRIGMAAAKGLCYVLNKPLITINTLQLIAHSAPHGDYTFLCPMVDARRNEVYCGVLNRGGDWVQSPQAHILSPHSFSELLDGHKILFCGNGAIKWEPTCVHKHAFFYFNMPTAKNMVALAEQSYNQQNFADIAYSEPVYLKDVFIKEK